MLVFVAEVRPSQVEILAFLEDNGLKRVSFTQSAANRFGRRLAATGTFYSHAETLFSLDDLSFLVADVDICRSRDVAKALDMASKTRVQQCLLVIRNGCNADEKTVLEAGARSLDRSTFFYTYSQDSKTWLSVIFVKSGGLAISELKFASNDSRRIEPGQQYDLTGIHLKTSSLTWEPYLMLENCNGVCEASGYLKDYMDLLAGRLNFTFETSRAEKWGSVVEASGSSNVSWIGSVGDVVHGRSHASLSTWNWMQERDSVVDHVPVGRKTHVLAWIPKYPSPDLSFFFRPFSAAVWALIAATGVVGWIVCGMEGEEAVSGRIASLALHCCFVVLHAFYGGALTMFFATSVAVPFGDVSDVLRAYPEWRLISQTGNEMTFMARAKYDRLYLDFWSRSQNGEEDAFVDLETALHRLNYEQTVLYAEEGVIRSHFDTHPDQVREIEVLAKVRVGHAHILLNENSALTPVFTAAAAKLRESGEERMLQAKWEGSRGRRHRVAEVEAVSISHQSVLLFVVGTCVLVVCPVALCVELAWKVYRTRHDKK